MAVTVTEALGVEERTIVVPEEAWQEGSNK
jgi:hypothetical protein